MQQREFIHTDKRKMAAMSTGTPIGIHHVCTGAVEGPVEAILYSSQFSRWIGRWSLAENETGEEGRQAIVTEQKSDGLSYQPASRPARSPYVLRGRESKVRHHDCAFLLQVQLCGCSRVGRGSDLAGGMFLPQ